MIDDELEQRLRTHYQAIDPGPAPRAVGGRIADALECRANRPMLRFRPTPAFATVMAAVIVVSLGIVFGLRPGGFLGGAGASVTPPASPQPGLPSASASPSPISGTSPAPTPLPPGPDVQAGGMVDPLHGWAVVDHRLLVTGDGGATWRDSTPPGGLGNAAADYLLGAAFVDAQHGWVAINEAFTSASDASYGRVDIWRTTDGGSTWSKAQLPKAVYHPFGESMAAVQFDFLDASRGFAFLSGNLAKGKNDSDLFWTADGGRTWSADRPTGTGSVGIEGTVGFATATDGVVVNALHGAGIAVTHDGGRTWTDATLTPPAATGTQLFFAQPVFFDGRAGLVSIDFQGDTGSATHVYRTADAGSSWTLVATPPTDVSALSFVDPQRWIGLTGSEVVRTADGGQTWERGPAVGPPGAPGSLLMTDAQHGSALVGMNVCLTFKSNCSSRTGLYATVDGGSTWTQLWPG
jgi:photosystem II stability/assembly factor-like uncharacterized protein